MDIPFNKPEIMGSEIRHVREAVGERTCSAISGRDGISRT